MIAFRGVRQIIVSGLAEMGGMQFRSGMSPLSMAGSFIRIRE